MSLSPRRAQTSLEVLFILAIIMVGIAFIVPPYLQSTNNVSIDMYLKDSATNACAYINSGVIKNDSRYVALNTIIKASNYTYRAFNLEGINTSEAGNVVNATILITYHGPNYTSINVSREIKDYLLKDISSRPNAHLTGKTLYIGGKEVRIKVIVRRELG